MKKIIILYFLIFTFINANTFTINTFEFSPYIQKKEGLVIDIIKELFKRSNIEYKIESLPQLRAIREAKYKENNIVSPLQRSQERETQFKWVGPVLITQTAFYTLKDTDIKIDVLEDLNNHEVLVKAGSVDEEYLNGFGIKTQSVKSNLQNVKKLKLKRANIWATDTISASYYSSLANIEIKKHLIFLTTLRSLAFNINTSDETINLLNNNLQTMYNDGTIKNILLKYSKQYDIQDNLKFFN